MKLFHKIAEFFRWLEGNKSGSIPLDLDKYIASLPPYTQREPIIDTGREQIRLEKRPKELNFEEEIGGTLYEVTASFDDNAQCDIVSKIRHMMMANPDGVDTDKTEPT